MTPAEVVIERATGAGSRRAVLDSSAAVLEEFSPYTADHSGDVVVLCDAIAKRLGVQGDELTELLAAAQLHDIGKVAVPSSIINKPGPLDEHEWGIMREHTVEGERIVESMPHLVAVARIIRSCHERVDGGGYPDGLAGEQIPLAARIIFCADAFHAIRCDRPYRPGRSAAKALAELQANAGTQFDPRAVDALVDAARELRYSAPARGRAWSRGGRSRRALVLLLTLAIAGSASAATRVGPFHALLRGGDEAQAPAPTLGCDPPAACPLADLGPLGTAFSNGSASSRSPHGLAVATGAVSGRARDAGSRAGHGGGGGEDRTASGGHHEAAAGPSSGAGATGSPSRSPVAQPPARGHSGRPPSPGRSEQAPGRPEQTGKPPKTGTPGRSEEAPGHYATPPSRPSHPAAPSPPKGPANGKPAKPAKP